MYTDIISAAMDEYRAQSIRAAELHDIINRRFDPQQYDDRAERRAAFDALTAEINAAAAELQIIEIMMKVEHDNMRRAIYNYAMPIALDIMRKYSGKPYGEKTRQKISDEMKARTGCALYFSSSGYGGEIHITPLNAEGYNNMAFRYNDFEIYGKYIDGSKRSPLTGNLINGDLTPDDIYLNDCAEHVDDPHARAIEIMHTFDALKRDVKKIQDAISAFNRILPSGIDRRDIPTIRNYL